MKQELQNKGFTPLTVELGEVEIEETMSAEQHRQFDKHLRQFGLQLMTDPKVILADKIKRLIIEWVQNPEHYSGLTFSTVISSELHHDYSYLSRLFKEKEGKTIEQTIIMHKIEWVKELLLNTNHTLMEISLLMGYSSLPALSNQFKKVTGVTPSQFKELGLKREKGIDEL